MTSSITASLLMFPDKEYIEEGETICYKNISSIDISVITSSDERLDRISVLKLEFCNLTKNQIEVLAYLLRDNYSISELSVNGNPNDTQNFYLLLHSTNILSLSLKFCAIDSKGIVKISNELYYPFESSLLHLNLSSNSICNEGIEHIVRFLRINRTLISLNLADNKIYDMGCTQLMLTLQKFPLNFEEIVIRRGIKFEILRKNINLSSDSKFDIPVISPVIVQSKASFVNSSQITINRNMINFAKFILLNHPFMWDPNEEKEDEDIYCQGNDALINLNLSYNRITRGGLNCIIDMLHYQIHNYACDKGISRISTEGNDCNSCEHILNKLKELVGLKAKKSLFDNKKKSHLNLRKRS